MYRQVSTAIWTDDIILSMSPEQKLLFLYLHTNPYASACGIYKMQLRTMGFQLGLTAAPIESALRGLAAAFPDFVAADWETGEVALLQYPKQILISASKRVMGHVEKEIEKVQSIMLLRLLIAKNSASISKPYLAQIRRLQVGEINNSKNYGDVAIIADNQQINGKKEKEKEKEINTAACAALPSPEKTEKHCFVNAVIDYFNQRTNRGFSPKTETTRKAINARVADGYTLDDFKAVIDNRADAWSGDEKMREFLRPETLFRPAHFESYLNAARTAPKANTDTALKDIDLDAATAEKYAAYINHAQEKYAQLWNSSVRVFSHSEFIDYLENRSLPAIQYGLTTHEKRRLLLDVHDRLNASADLRKKYSKTIDAFYAAARQALRQETIKL